MITSKQRSYLKAIGHDIEPIIHIGKFGLSQNLLKQIDDALEAREIIKGKVLESSEKNAKEIANEIAGELKAEFVQTIGNKFILYRESKKEKRIQLP